MVPEGGAKKREREEEEETVKEEKSQRRKNTVIFKTMQGRHNFHFVNSKCLETLTTA